MRDNQMKDCMIPQRNRKKENELEYVSTLSGPSYFKRKLSEPSLYECDECDFQAFNSNLMEQHMQELNHNSWRFNPNTYGIFTLQVPRGGVDSTNPLENPLSIVFVQFFFNPAKLIYNCRSHAKGDSQKFKIEEIEEL